jgi:polysaccharide pyruvyl transferase WcaK-like protein
MTIIDDIRAVFGDDVAITVGTVSRAKTLRVVAECETLHVVELPSIFFGAVWRLTRQHDISMLVEGSTFQDNWSSVLLYLFLWTAWCAAIHGHRCVAYAVDAGRMCRFNRWLTRRVCRGIDLIITRTDAARAELRELGVTRPIVVTTDTAFQFEGSWGPRRHDRLVVGLAPVEFHHWPVRFRLWGRREHCYQWPYYFSWNDERRRESARLVSAWAGLTRHVVIERGWRVEVFAMEEVDRRICAEILENLEAPVRKYVTTVITGEMPPSVIVKRLRQLDYLVTSRYHACVLSMAASVPQMSLYHDQRLNSIYRELGLERFAVSYRATPLSSELLDGFSRLVENAYWQRAVIADRHRGVFLPRCFLNRTVLREWAIQTFGQHRVRRGEA